MVGVSLRTAIKDRAIVPVAINHFDRTVGLHRESDIAQHGPGGKLALKLRIHAFTVALSMEDSADADLGIDLVGGDFHLKLGGVAAITFARDVLRVVSAQRKIVSRRGRTDARGQSKTDVAYKWTDHYDSRLLAHEIVVDVMQRANAGFKRPVGSGVRRAWRDDSTSAA
jgi:hypothetical protein